jgi:hypothetical protein
VHVTDTLPIAYEELKAFYQTNAERAFKLESESVPSPAAPR